MLVVDPPITVRHSNSCATTLEVKPRATALGNVTVRGRIFVMGHDIAAMLRGPQGKGAARPVAVLTIEKLRGEIEDIRSRVPALAAR